MLPAVDVSCTVFYFFFFFFTTSCLSWLRLGVFALAGIAPFFFFFFFFFGTQFNHMEERKGWGEKEEKGKTKEKSEMG